MHNITSVREHNVLSPRYALMDVPGEVFEEKGEVFEEKLPGSGICSPNKQLSQSCVSKTIQNELAGIESLELQESKLLELLESRSSWKYGIYNELARVQFQLNKDDECLASITQAKKLVEKLVKPDHQGHVSGTHPNAHYKSIVYYNYSQFLAALKIDDKSSQQEAFKNIATAIELYPGTEDDNELQTSEAKDYLQDCLVHKAFIAPYLPIPNPKLARDLSCKAFKINPKRYVQEFTLDGTGRELFFQAIAHNMTDVFDELISIQESQIKATGVSTIQSNIESDLGVCPLYFAIHQSNLIAIEKLFSLGANPLYSGEDGSTVLYSVIDEQKWQFAELLIQNIEQKIISGEVSREDMCMLKNEFSELALPENVIEKIQNFVTDVKSLSYEELLQQYKPHGALEVHTSIVTSVDQSVQTDSDEEAMLYSPDTFLTADVIVIEDNV